MIHRALSTVSVSGLITDK